MSLSLASPTNYLTSNYINTQEVTNLRVHVVMIMIMTYYFRAITLCAV